jgi:hypothetical protein
MPTICSYFDPCSQDFNAIEKFKNLSCLQQTGIGLVTTLLACTIIFAPCATAVFRLLVDYCTATPPLTPTDEKAKEIVKKALPEPNSRTQIPVINETTVEAPKKVAEELSKPADTSAEAWFQEPSGRSQFTGGLHSACTPLAVMFAASAGKVPSEEGVGTPQEIAQILDTFLKADIRAAGFENDTNYGAEDSVRMVNAMMKRGIQIETTWTVGANGTDAALGMTSEFTVTEQAKTWKELISELQKGQGAIIIAGGYAVAVRRLNAFWEFFDVHNGKDLGALEKGAYIKRCSSAQSACAFLKHVIASGPAGAGIENGGLGMLANSVEITLLKVC